MSHIVQPFSLNDLICNVNLVRGTFSPGNLDPFMSKNKITTQCKFNYTCCRVRNFSFTLVFNSYKINVHNTYIHIASDLS